MQVRKCRVNIVGKGFVEVPVGTRLLDAIKKIVPEFPAPCNGKGLCGLCKVRVLSGELTPPTGNELVMQLPKNMRLACQARVLSDVTIELLPSGRVKVVVGGLEPRVKVLGSIVEAEPIEVPSYRRVGRSMQEYIERALGLYGTLLKGARAISVAGEGRYKAVVHCRKLLDLVPERAKVLAAAVDVGSTKIAAYIFDVESGSTLAEGYVLNPQLKYGDDVVSRISALIEGKATLKSMCSETVEAVEELLLKLLSEVGAEPRYLETLCIVGNSVSLMIALGIDPRSLGTYPYKPPFTGPLTAWSSELGFKELEAAVYVPPAITSFVGSDTTACLTVLKALEAPQNSLLLDIGTNTEVALVKSFEEIYVTSAPAGPAFEGGVSCGTKSFENAIDRVSIINSKVVIHPQVKKPAGLSGAGVLSLVAELLRKGLLEPSGRLRGGKFTVYEGDGIRLEFTQKDVREVQKAKAAIASAWKILAMEAGVKKFSMVYLAGSFGSSLDPRDAIDVGLIPRMSPSRVVALGNAAGVGAKLIALNSELRSFAESIPSKARFVELATHKNFTRIWLESLRLGVEEL